MCFFVPRTCRGFTLIELLIVVAIIAVLAAIAVPNFLEAQVRAKVSRVKADARTIVVAVESYRVDHNKMPVPLGAAVFWGARQARLTTPVAYLSSLPKDPFTSKHAHNPTQLFDVEVRTSIPPPIGIPDLWFQLDASAPLVPGKKFLDGYIRSWGPDQREAGMTQTSDPDFSYPFGWSLKDAVYDPTNGTVSNGDIWACLPGPVYYPR